MSKLIVSSFYNCLINNEEAIPISTMLEIERIRKKGNKFAICTNANYKEILYYNKDFPFIDYIISLNGSYVYDVCNNKCLFKKKLPIAIIEKITKTYPNNKLLFFTEDEILTTKPFKDIYKIALEINNKTNLSFLNNLKINTSIFYYNKKKYLEINSGLTNNFKALEKIIKNKFSIDNITAIIANDTEISLFKNIPNSYIVSSATKNIKQRANNKKNNNLIDILKNI